MTTSHRAFVFVSIITVLALTATSLAVPIYVRDAPGGDGYFVPGTGGKVKAAHDGNRMRTISTGTLDLEMDFGSGYVSMPTYCLQPHVTIKFGQYPKDPVGLAYQQVALIDAGVGLTSHEISTLEVLWANAYELSMQDKVSAAAFQTIVWEMTRDDEFDLAAGDFYLKPQSEHAFNTKVQHMAEVWWTNIDEELWTDSVMLAAVSNDRSQDFLIPVPEPMTMILLAVGALMALRPCDRRRAAILRL